MKEETTTTVPAHVILKSMYPVIVPAAITAMTASLATFDEGREQRGNQVYLPVSNAPDQAHQHNENYEPFRTTIAEWGASGTNTSSALASTTWTSTMLMLPIGSDPFVVSRLKHAGLFVVVSEIESRSERSVQHSG